MLIVIHSDYLLVDDACHEVSCVRKEGRLYTCIDDDVEDPGMQDACVAR